MSVPMLQSSGYNLENTLLPTMVRQVLYGGAGGVAHPMPMNKFTLLTDRVTFIY